MEKKRLLPSRIALYVVGVLLLTALWAAVFYIQRQRSLLARTNALRSIGLQYHNFFYIYKRSPSSLEEFEKYCSRGNERAGNEYAFQWIRDGRLILIWNAQILPTGEEEDAYLLGYEAKTPETGGFVIKGGGSIEHVTSQQFATLPKIATYHQPEFQLSLPPSFKWDDDRWCYYDIETSISVLANYKPSLTSEKCHATIDRELAANPIYELKGVEDQVVNERNCTIVRYIRTTGSKTVHGFDTTFYSSSGAVQIQATIPARVTQEKRDELERAILATKITD